MIATIKPLGSKYYGTIIETEMGQISMWLKKEGDHRPSDRELAVVGMYRSEWEDNPDRWDEIDSGHYETQACYELAQLICMAIHAVEL